MKIRSGFVSNSSSSSFMLCGWTCELTSEIITRLEEEFGSKFIEDEEYPEDALREFLYECGDLSAHSNEDGEALVWGKYYCSTYNESQEKLDLNEMYKILEQMKELGKTLNLEEPHFYLVGI